MPIIAEKYPVNRKSQTLFGHSLSGLFVLWTLFTRPELFQTYLVFSPSIRWNKYEIMDYAKEAAYTHERKNLCMIVGGKEGFMVKDARNLYSVLQSNSRIHANFILLLKKIMLPWFRQRSVEPFALFNSLFEALF